MARIVLIEDQGSTRTAVAEMLKRGGHQVVEAANGREGMKIIAVRSPEVVVTDILMPEMDGIETIKQLSKIYSNLPIIVMTASIGTPYLNVALKLGAKAGLHKPFTQKELLSAINGALEP